MSLALLGGVAVGALVFSMIAGKGKKKGNVFPGVPDEIAFTALGMQDRALLQCPDRENEIALIGLDFAEGAGADPEEAFAAYIAAVASVCPGIRPEADDEALGRVLWEAAS